MDVKTNKKSLNLSQRLNFKLNLRKNKISNLVSNCKRMKIPFSNSNSNPNFESNSKSIHDLPYLFLSYMNYINKEKSNDINNTSNSRVIDYNTMNNSTIQYNNNTDIEDLSYYMYTNLIRIFSILNEFTSEEKATFDEKCQILYEYKDLILTLISSSFIVSLYEFSFEKHMDFLEIHQFYIEILYKLSYFIDFSNHIYYNKDLILLFNQILLSNSTKNTGFYIENSYKIKFISFLKHSLFNNIDYIDYIDIKKSVSFMSSEYIQVLYSYLLISKDKSIESIDVITEIIYILSLNIESLAYFDYEKETEAMRVLLLRVYDLFNNLYKIYMIFQEFVLLKIKKILFFLEVGLLNIVIVYDSIYMYVNSKSKCCNTDSINDLCLYSKYLYKEIENLLMNLSQEMINIFSENFRLQTIYINSTSSHENESEIKLNNNDDYYENKGKNEKYYNTYTNQLIIFMFFKKTLEINENFKNKPRIDVASLLIPSKFLINLLSDQHFLINQLEISFKFITDTLCCLQAMNNEFFLLILLDQHGFLSSLMDKINTNTQLNIVMNVAEVFYQLIDFSFSHEYMKVLNENGYLHDLIYIFNYYISDSSILITVLKSMRLYLSEGRSKVLISKDMSLGDGVNVIDYLNSSFLKIGQFLIGDDDCEEEDDKEIRFLIEDLGKLINVK